MQYNDMEMKRKLERKLYIAQKIIGIFIIICGIAFPFVFDGDCTASILLIPIGILYVFTKENLLKELIVYD